MNRFSLENGTEMRLRVRLEGDDEESVIQPSSADVRRIHGINPSLTWTTAASRVNVAVFTDDAFPGAPPKVFTMLPGTVTLLCSTPFGDACPPLSLMYVVRSALS